MREECGRHISKVGQRAKHEKSLVATSARCTWIADKWQIMRLTPVPPFFSTELFSALAPPRELLIRQLSLFVSAACRSLFNQVLGHFEVQLLLLHLGATSGPALPQCALTGDSFGKLLANSSLEWPLKSTRGCTHWLPTSCICLYRRVCVLYSVFFN